MAEHDDRVRVDRWLWSIRLFATRSAASDACRAGHVRIGGRPAKPAATVQVGDVVDVRAQGRPWRVEAVRLIDKRVGAPIAATCFVDRSDPVEAPARGPEPAFERPRGAGRPTKRDRRQMDRFRGR